MGHRIAKHIYTSANVWEKSTYYLRDAQGNVMSVYEHSNDNQSQTVSYKLAEQHAYGSSRLGMRIDSLEMISATVDTIHYKRTLGGKHYEFSNHLGNVLTLVSDKIIPVDANSDNETDYYQAHIISVTDYSPFGVTLDGRNFNATASRFGAGGHEKVDEYSGNGNTVDMGDRWLDPILGRTPKPDAHGNNYPSISPYSYALNNPINVIDKDGKDVYLVVWATSDGHIGHAVIAVDNYKQVERQVEKWVEYDHPKGGTFKVKETVTQTVWEKDGTVTYYDLWPGNADGVGPKNAGQNVTPSYNVLTTTINDIINTDVTGSEGYAPDGVIQLSTSYETDQQVIKSLEQNKTDKPYYNGRTNNCSDFAECGVETATGENIKANEFIPFKMSTTPNKLFRKTAEQPNATVIKDPGEKVEKSFIKGVTEKKTIR